MVCVACYVWPVLLLIWYKFIHPYILKVWNVKSVYNERIHRTSESGENENNINASSDRSNNERMRSSNIRRHE